MSLMYSKKNRGPRIEPWGTPQEISFLNERWRKGIENEQTLANLSPAEEATSQDEVEIDIFVPLLSC